MTDHGWTIELAERVISAERILSTKFLSTPILLGDDGHRLIIIECEDRSYTVGTDILAQYLDAIPCDYDDCGIYTMVPQQCHDGLNYCDQHISAAGMACCRDCAYDGTIDKDY